MFFVTTWKEYMKNVMKLSMLGLALTVGASELQAMTMNRIAAKGSKLVNLASRNKLATAGVAAASLFALDLMINKAPVYAKLTRAKAVNWRAQRDWNKKYAAFEVRKDVLADAELAKEQAIVAAAEAKAGRTNFALADVQEQVEASSLYAVRAAKFAGNGFVAGVSKIPGVTTGASKVKAGGEWAYNKLPNRPSAESAKFWKWNYRFWKKQPKPAPTV
jgi:hypothetical protein